MSDAFSEVQEELRQQRLHDMWARYGQYLIISVIAVIIGTAGSAGYSHFSHQKRLEQTEALYGVFDAADKDAVDSQVITALDMRPSLQAIALLKAAGDALNAGDQESAAQFYEAVLTLDLAEDFSYGDYARLILARLQPARSVELLTPLANNDLSPWRYDALLALAAEAAQQRGVYKEALALLAKIDEGAPAAIASQANALKHVYEVGFLNLKKQEGQ